MSFPRSKEARVNKAGRMETPHTLVGNPKLIMHESIEGAILAAGNVSEFGGCPPTDILAKADAPARAAEHSAAHAKELERFSNELRFELEQAAAVAYSSFESEHHAVIERLERQHADTPAQVEAAGAQRAQDAAVVAKKLDLLAAKTVKATQNGV